MLIKTSELTGAALDWAVAKCEGKRPSLFIFQQTGKLAPEHTYSTNWSQGGSIIERERITLRVSTMVGTAWVAFYDVPNQYHAHIREKNPTPLIAAMRCYVASKLGDTVEIPDELFA